MDTPLVAGPVVVTDARSAGRIDHKPIIDRHGGQRIEGSTMIFSVRHPEARLTGSGVFRDYLARTQPPEAISE